MRRRLSISVRLTLWYGLTLLLLLSAFAVFCYTGFHLALHRDFDRHLTHEQRELMPFVSVDGAAPSFEGLDALTSVAYRTEGIYGTYVRLLTPDGTVRYQSPNFDGYEALPVVLPAAPREATISQTWSGLPARTRYVPLQPRVAGEGVLGWLELTGFEWSLHRELLKLRLTLILGILVSVAFALVGGWWLARRTLRPVAAMTQAAGEMGARDLSARLPADFGTRDELTELAETFNDLLSRLEGSVARERRFTSNAAHELLTPLATLRSEAEVALRRPRAVPDYQSALERLVADIERMTATVQGLLHLARADALEARRGEHLNLSALVQKCVAHLRPDAEAKGLALEAHIAPNVEISAQSAPLTEVLGNLIGNAVKYTPTGGTIGVQLSSEQGEAVLTVTDTGIGFEQTEAGRLFDRFYRSDAAPVQAQRGSGLGLAIVKTIVESWGGTVTARSEGAGRGARFEVRMPSV